MNPTASPLHLTSHWFIKPGNESKVLEGVAALAHEVETQEPGTLSYLVHTPYGRDDLQSLPPTVGLMLIFVEMYRDVAAFNEHVNGPLFKKFVADYGSCFIAHGAGPYTTVQFLTQQAGFLRASLVSSTHAHGATASR